MLFESISVLKTKYCETHILKSLTSLRLQISEVLQDTQDNVISDKRASGQGIDAVIASQLDQTQLRPKLMQFVNGID